MLQKDDPFFKQMESAPKEVRYRAILMRPEPRMPQFVDYTLREVQEFFGDCDVVAFSNAGAGKVMLGKRFYKAPDRTTEIQESNVYASALLGIDPNKTYMVRGDVFLFSFDFEKCQFEDISDDDIFQPAAIAAATDIWARNIITAIAMAKLTEMLAQIEDKEDKEDN